MLGGTEIKRIDCYKYLGIKIANYGRSTEEIASRAN